MKRRIILACLLVLVCLACSGRWLAAAEPMINGFDYVDADLRDILRSLGLAGNFNVLLTKDVTGTYTLYIKQPMKVREAIEMVARTYGYDVRWLNEEKTVVVVGSPETLKQNFDINLGLTKVFTLRYSAVAEISEALKVVVNPANVSLNPRTNQIVVTGSPLQLENAAEIVGQMDHPMPQVNIEARMEEILESEVQNLGLTWNTSFDLAVGSGFSLINATQLAAKLNALHTENKAVTLAQPNASCLDSQEATIFIGDKYPVASSTVTGSGTTTPTTTWKVDYHDIGTKLTIRPRVNKENIVTVYVKAEVSSILEEKDLGDAGKFPVIRTRTMESLTRLRDGQTFVMTGLIRRDDKTLKTGVPILDKLPLISVLFKNKKIDNTGTVICVFLTPHIQKVYEDELSGVTESAAATGGGSGTGVPPGQGGTDPAGSGKPAESATGVQPPADAGKQPPAATGSAAGETGGGTTSASATAPTADTFSAEEMAEKAADAAAAKPVTVDGGTTAPAGGTGDAAAPANSTGAVTPAEAGAGGASGTPAAGGTGASGAAGAAGATAGAGTGTTATPAAGGVPSPGAAPLLPRPEEIKHVAYTVKKGDTLASIGRKFGVDWEAIAGYNKLTKNSVLRVGQQLLIPIPDDHKYVVQPKETLWRIAKRYGVAVELLAEINNLADPTKLEVGQVIILPCSVSNIVNREY